MYFNDRGQGRDERREYGDGLNWQSQSERRGLWVRAPGGPVSVQNRVYTGDMRRVDHMRSTGRIADMDLQCLMTPVSAPGVGIVTGVAPFKDLTEGKSRMNTRKLEVMYAEHGNCMMVQHAEGVVKVFDNGD
ncbi:hypothetical protein QAD02_023735 [Eretmocerus hayati]|uniref:Uncharacterized protein n=1 Tax=Eretmocerus hayati TaxID=131215 RepID=A0ACC2PWH8_9HYME|nr:hypothetical protein QAD02_023735 [Eretmocerus hayati]